MQRKIANYENFMAELSVNIMPVTETIGLISMIPLPFEISQEDFMKYCQIPLKRASELGLEYLILDASRMPGIRMLHNLPGFEGIIQSFRLIGVNVIISGINAEVAMTIVQAGGSINVPTFPRLADALKSISS